jgi:hypothetical protein
MRRIARTWLWMALSLAFGACGGSGDDLSATDGGGDSDSDADSDADGGADAGGDDDCPNPTALDDADGGTGLEWLTCRAGQCFVDGACAWTAGETLAMGWDAAAAACPNGARLAEAEELMGLLGNCTELDLTSSDTATCDACDASAGCDAIYPGAEDLGDFSYDVLVWSATELSDTLAWSVNLKTGVVSSQPKDANMTALCVSE